MRTYSPEETDIFFASQQITGFTDDSIIELAYDSPSFTSKRLMDGSIVRTHKRNDILKVKLHLNQTSLANDLMHIIYATDRSTGDGIFPFLFKDRLNGVLITSLEAWIDKMPDMLYNVSIEARVWEICLANPSIIASPSTGSDAFDTLMKLTAGNLPNLPTDNLRQIR